MIRSPAGLRNYTMLGILALSPGGNISVQVLDGLVGGSTVGDRL